MTVPPSDPRYAALWERSPTRAPFTHPDAVAAYARAFGWPAHVLLADDWSAAVPVLAKRRGPFTAAALPHLAPVWRPVLAEPPTESATHARTSSLDALLARLEDAADQVTLALADDDPRPYAWAGWTVTPRSTYLLDLSDDVEAGFSTSTRRTVRKEADGFEIVEDEALTAEAVGLMMASYRRGGEPLGLDERAVAGLTGAFVAAGLARTFAARRGGSTKAAIVAAHDGRTAFYWVAGSEPGPAMTVLIAHTLRQLQADGIAAFDFCGANTPPIAEFKRRFGPTLAPAPIARRAAHPALRLIDRLR